MSLYVHKLHSLYFIFIPGNTPHRSDVGPMLVRCRRRWVNIGLTFGQHVSSQQTQNICITFIQRRPNVFDVGPTLYKCYTNVLCLLGCLLFIALTITPPRAIIIVFSLSYWPIKTLLLERNVCSNINISKYKQILKLWVAVIYLLGICCPSFNNANWK